MASISDKFYSLTDWLFKFGFNQEASYLLKIAGKKDILINRLGVSEEVADWLIERTGKLAVWFADQIIRLELPPTDERLNLDPIQNLSEEDLNVDLKIHDIKLNKQDGKVLTVPRLLWVYNGNITLIMDWLRHPQVERVNLRELTFDEAIQKSKEFHDNLITTGGDIDYLEENQIIKHYDDGFYWAKLKDRNQEEQEGKRMGHCGRSDADTIFSLRSIKPHGKDHTINTSHITVAYDTSAGKIYQSKGKKNSKPSEKYFPYIFDLIKSLNNFSGFLPEYDVDNDYTFKDMSDEQVKQLAESSSQAFKNISGQAELVRRNLISEITYEKYEIDISVKNITKWIKTHRISSSIIEKVLDVDFAFFNFEPVHYSAKDLRSLDLSPRIENQIKIILKKRKPNLEIEDLKEYLIENFNDDDVREIITTIGWGTSDAHAAAYIHDLYEEILKCLEHYGEVDALNGSGAILILTLKPFVDYWGIPTVERIFNHVENAIEPALYALLDNYEEKPVLEDKESSYPDADMLENSIMSQLENI